MRSSRESESRASLFSAAQRHLIDAQVAHMGGADACLFAVNDARDAIIVAHATPRIRRAVSKVRMPVGSGVSGWVAANRSTIRCAEPGLDIGELANAYALKSCAAVPVFVCADLFGVLTVYFTDAALSEEVVAVVGLLAQEIGLSIARPQAHVRHAAWPTARLAIAHERPHGPRRAAGQTQAAARAASARLL
jgi:GAF domain-containing protein